MMWMIPFALSAYAQVMPTEDKTVGRTLPEEPGFKVDTGYKKQFENIARQMDNLQKNQLAAQRTLQEATPEKKGALSSKRKLRQNSALPVQKIVVEAPASNAQVFAVSNAPQMDETLTVLPAGSFVKAKVVSGVEANTLEPYPVLLQLSHAFTGPNRAKIDLSSCFMIAKARANLSTERVIMETDTLSCVRENGEHFKTAARGYTAGEDSTFGSTGTFISKQGQVLLAAVLSNIAKNAGDAVALAQQTTTVVGTDKAATATNVTGDKAAFIAGKSMVDASSTIAQWYLDYAKQLIPSIGIGSGQDVHVIMLDTIYVPALKE